MSARPQTRLRFPPIALAFVLLALVAACVPFLGALHGLFDVWNLQPEYSHGILIPPIAAFLLWRERAWLSRTPFEGSWLGLPVIAAGVALWLIGGLATIITLTQYAFLLMVYGLVLSLTGWAVFRRLWMPLFILIFMVPLPAFFSNTLSLQLQLLSSALGVAVIRLAGISVFLEGNVIDLGGMQLQVAEACDGLRYLFPLMTLAFVIAYLFRAPMWKRALLFASSVPIAILMNSLRIGVIGITVEYWGQDMAEGMLHDFEGWVVFMLSTAVLLFVAFLLARLGRNKSSLRDALVVDFGTPPARATQAETRRIPPAFVGATAVAALTLVLSFALPERKELQPMRATLIDFPASIGDWTGQQQAMDRVYIDTLKFDDYVMANYTRPRSNSGRGLPINFYVAYYGSQRSGRSVHSPRACLPGGGWNVRSFEQRVLQRVDAGGRPLQVNRAVIELGAQKQIVYYWFQQRGRVMTNEYLVKWFILWDALTRNRTDGALVRLAVPVPAGMSEDAVEAEIQAFAARITPQLERYVPG